MLSALSIKVGYSEEALRDTCRRILINQAPSRQIHTCRGFNLSETNR